MKFKKKQKKYKNISAVCGQCNYTLVQTNYITWVISFKRRQLKHYKFFAIKIVSDCHQMSLSLSILLPITATLALRPVNSLLLIIYICDFLFFLRRSEQLEMYKVFNQSFNQTAFI